MPAAVRFVVGVVVGVIAEVFPEFGGTFVANIAFSFALGGLVSLLSGLPKSNIAPVPQQFMANGSTYPRTIIYGKTRVSGVLMFQQAAGPRNQYLWYVIALSTWQVYDPKNDS